MSKLWNPARVQRAERLRLVPRGWEAVAGPDDFSTADNAFAEGYAEARRVVEAEMAAERDMLVQLIDAASSIAPHAPEPLAALLAEAVLRLVADIVGQAPVDPELLRQRALTLAAAIHEPEGPACVVVHPDSVFHLAGLPDHIQVRADITLKPGSVRIVTGDGFIEDGVTAAFDRLRTAIAEMGLGA